MALASSVAGCGDDGLVCAQLEPAGTPAAINVNEDSANGAAVTLGLSTLTYGPGGGSDEASQTLTYTVTAIPSFVKVYLADGTSEVTTGTVLADVTVLQGLKYKTLADVIDALYAG